ncbi:hypothetical protein [Pseudoalteromonas sp. NBT06-2]|nr:hypothetical protein [Pseudoalteromonas sp. NBT06-2]
MDAVFAAVDLTTVGAFVGVAALAIIAYTMGFKGIDISKRAIKKA